jgi:uncharacterized membrane protein YfcA
MEQELLILSLAVLGAAALQSATGIGFGIIAGPVLLVALNDGSAIQISAMLNLVIALLLMPSVWDAWDRQLMKSLLIGIAVGSPLGLLVFLSIDTALLKILAGIVVLFALYSVVRGAFASAKNPDQVSGGSGQIPIGMIAGMMGGSLAMPGPVPAAWMASKGFAKDTIRATILVMFVFAYGLALVLQATLAGISADSIELSAKLLPATAIGVWLGRLLERRMSETVFRRLLVAILVLTAVILFSTLN